MLWCFEAIVCFWDFNFLRNYPEYLDTVISNGNEEFAIRALLAMVDED